MKIKYAINIVSLMKLGRQNQGFPGRFFTSPQELIKEALEIGYDGVQAIPTRGMTGNETGVLLCEDAWNAVDSLWAALRHHTGSEGMPATLNDWVVSPAQVECNTISTKFAGRNIPKVVHQFGNAGEILEINSRIIMPLSDIKQKCLDLGMSVCIDTLHLDEYIKTRLQLGEYSKQYWLDVPWCDALDEIAKTLGNLVTVIHIHSSKRPVESFNESWQGGLMFLIAETFLQRKSTSDEVTLVAEYNPGKANLLRPQQISMMAKRALVDMQKVVLDAMYQRRLTGAEHDS